MINVRITEDREMARQGPERYIQKQVGSTLLVQQAMAKGANAGSLKNPNVIIIDF